MSTGPPLDAPQGLLIKYRRHKHRATKGVRRCSVVKCSTRNPGVLGSSPTGSSGVFRGSVLGQDTSDPQFSTSETQERHELCELCRDMTEILFKAA